MNYDMVNRRFKAPTEKDHVSVGAHRPCEALNTYFVQGTKEMCFDAGPTLCVSQCGIRMLD